MTGVQTSMRLGISCAVLVLVTSLALAAPALGSYVDTAVAKGGRDFASARPGLATQKSSSLAGYSPDFPYFVAPVSETTTIVVPKIKHCTTKKQAVSAEVQVDLTDSGYSGFDQAGLLIECAKSKARYYPETHGRSSLQAHPGDTVVLTENVTSKKLTASVKDMTHKAEVARIVVELWRRPPGFDG